MLENLSKDMRRTAGLLLEAADALDGNRLGRAYNPKPQALPVKRVLSQAARNRIAAAQRARWARVRSGKK